MFLLLYPSKLFEGGGFTVFMYVHLLRFGPCGGHLISTALLTVLVGFFCVSFFTLSFFTLSESKAQDELS